MKTKTEHQELYKRLSPTKFEEGNWVTHSDEAIAYFESTHTRMDSCAFVYNRENQVHKVIKSTGKRGFDLIIEMPNNGELAIESIYYRLATEEEVRFNAVNKLFK